MTAKKQLTLPRITTPRLELEPVSVALAEAVVAGDLSAVRAAEGWPHDGTERGLRNALRNGHTPGWFVVLDGEAIGDCGLHGDPNADGEVEIGFGLAAPFRGQGYGAELVTGLVAWLSAQEGITRIIARTAKDNAGSRRVLERAGLVAVGTSGERLTYATPTQRITPP